MSSLTREVAFGKTSAFRSEDFTAPQQQLPARPTFGRQSDTGFGRSSSAQLYQGPAPVVVAAAPSSGPAASPPPSSSRADLTGPYAESAAASDVEAHEPLLEVATVSVSGPAGGGRQILLQDFSRRVRIGINASWAVNITLLIAKIVAFFLSMSYSVLASAVDSLVDLLSQGLLAVAEYQAATFDPRYPIGRTRMAELSVIGCGVVMFISTALVIREASGALWDGFHGHIPDLQVGPAMYAILGAASALKLGLWLYCRTLQKNPIMVALAQDHLNDVMSNAAAVLGATVAWYVPAAWWADAAMALVFAVIIIRNWVLICMEQTDHIVGLGADDDLVKLVTDEAINHHPLMQLDRIIAYHHGAHFAVEVEVVLPEDMTVRESHDIALTLQHKIEAIESVERAFVHVDYRTRSIEEHKVDRNLKLGEKDVMKAMTPDEARLSLIAEQEAAGRAAGGPSRTGSGFAGTVSSNGQAIPPPSPPRL